MAWIASGLLPYSTLVASAAEETDDPNPQRLLSSDASQLSRDQPASLSGTGLGIADYWTGMDALITVALAGKE